MRIGDFLIGMAIALGVVLVIVELAEHVPVLHLVQFVLILVIASIPVAMPAVLSVTMALGALVLSKRKAIVSRLQAIEEMAGVDVLCSDKTGTLTQNKLEMGEPVVFEAANGAECILAGALASKAENKDAIDLAVIASLANPNALKEYRFCTTPRALRRLFWTCAISTSRREARLIASSGISQLGAIARWALPVATTAWLGGFWVFCPCPTRRGRTRRRLSPGRKSMAST